MMFEEKCSSVYIYVRNDRHELISTYPKKAASAVEKHPVNLEPRRCEAVAQPRPSREAPSRPARHRTRMSQDSHEHDFFELEATYRCALAIVSVVLAMMSHRVDDHTDTITHRCYALGRLGTCSQGVLMHGEAEEKGTVKTRHRRPTQKRRWLVGGTDTREQTELMDRRVVLKSQVPMASVPNLACRSGSRSSARVSPTLLSFWNSYVDFARSSSHSHCIVIVAHYLVMAVHMDTVMSTVSLVIIAYPMR